MPQPGPTPVPLVRVIETGKIENETVQEENVSVVIPEDPANKSVDAPVVNITPEVTPPPQTTVGGGQAEYVEMNEVKSGVRYNGRVLSMIHDLDIACNTDSRLCSESLAGIRKSFTSCADGLIEDHPGEFKNLTEAQDICIAKTSMLNNEEMYDVMLEDNDFFGDKAKELGIKVEGMSYSNYGHKPTNTPKPTKDPMADFVKPKEICGVVYDEAIIEKIEKLDEICKHDENKLCSATVWSNRRQYDGCGDKLYVVCPELVNQSSAVDICIASEPVRNTNSINPGKGIEYNFTKMLDEEIVKYTKRAEDLGVKL
jgi:hypothetical protein